MSRPLLVIFLTIFVNLVGFGIIIPLLPFYAETFGASPLTIGLLFASFSAAQIFASPVLARAKAWTTGARVDDDASVERAFAQTAGAQPYRALSDAYRHYVRRSAPNGNGTKSNGNGTKAAKPPSRRTRT